MAAGNRAMTPEPPTLPKSAKELFLEALDRPATERSAFLRRACGEHGDLLARVGELLDAHERARDVLGEDTFGVPLLELARPIDVTAGDVLGRASAKSTRARSGPC
jgi:hypothetical protein